MNNLRTMFVLGGLGEGGSSVIQSVLKSLEDQAGLSNDRAAIIDCIGFKPAAQGTGMVCQTFGPSMTPPYGSARILPSSWRELSAIANSDEPIRLGSVCDLILDSVEEKDGTTPNTVIVIGGRLESGWDRFVTDEKLAVASQVKGQGIKFVFMPYGSTSIENSERIEQLRGFLNAAEAFGGVRFAFRDPASNDFGKSKRSLQEALYTIGHMIKGGLPFPYIAAREFILPEGHAFYGSCVKAFMNPSVDLR